MTGPGASYTNVEIADRLERLADLLELQEANPFRVRAYRSAAEVIAAHDVSVAELDDEGLTAMKGIGKDLARAVRDLVEAGEIPQLTALEREVPIGLLDVKRVPGVGPKRAITLWKSLGVTGLDDLEREARAGRVAALAGFGEKTQTKVLRGVEQVRAHRGRLRSVDAEVLVAPLVAHLADAAGVERVEVAGSLRRGRETIGDVDVVAQSDDPEPVMAALRTYRGVRDVVGSGRAKTSVTLEGGQQVDLRVVDRAAYGAALLYFTGSKSHNVELRSRAAARGMRLSEYGLFDLDDDGEPGVRRAGASEEEIYRALELDFVPVELREGRGEVAAAADGTLPRLLQLEDLRGDLHLHTTWSDGADDVATMVAACEARGYAYMAITDHSQALRMTGGLDAEKLARQWGALDDFEREHDGVTILRGLEVDIRKDGTLDLDDDSLERLDIVVASIHSHLELGRDAQTQRVIRALEHPQVNVLAHPTGRILGVRDPYAIDLDAVFAAAASRGVAIELNAAPQRLDVGDVDLMRAVTAGCTIVVDTDAHSVRGLEHMRFGVTTARRAWLGPEHVLNAWPLARVRAFLAKR
ncbi:MAG: DNA polymerase/3'-5' exonuclease PolX [Trueperaceae bacterium]|nr:DNA polymerase/3'-5' exonuclease PolX [Trueperaceae bacterium]